MMRRDVFMSVLNLNRDNNNDIRVVDLSLAKAGAGAEELKAVEDEAVIISQEADLTKLNSEKLRALLSHLDIAALNILCLARLQVREKSLKGTEIAFDKQESRLDLLHNQSL